MKKRKKTNESFGTNPWDPWSPKADLPDAKNNIALQKMKKKKINIVKKENVHTSAAPVNDPWVGIDSKANLTRVAEAADPKELSKSARIIKSIYKRNRMSAEPKVKNLDKKVKAGDEDLDARAIMTGGRTMTGQDRDIIEIDPILKKRKDGNQPKK